MNFDHERVANTLIGVIERALEPMWRRLEALERRLAVAEAEAREASKGKKGKAK